MERKRGRPWIWIGGTVALAFIAMIIVAAFRHSPYSFLDRFHPKRVEVDFDKLYATLPGKLSRAPSGVPKMTMLVFKYQDASAILKSMRGELSSARGFITDNMYGAGVETFSRDEAWMFHRGPKVTTGTVALPSEFAMFKCGQIAGFEEVMYEKGFGAATTTSLTPPSPACIVLYVHEESWIEKSLDSLRNFLHL